MRSNLKEQTPRKKHQQIILIQTKGSRHQSEKAKRVAWDLVVTHDQVFNWTKAKTSETSVTPLLKITLFLCFHNSLTTAIQTAPHTSPEASLSLNWKKFSKGTLWDTNVDRTPPPPCKNYTKDYLTRSHAFPNWPWWLSHLTRQLFMYKGWTTL